MSTSRWGHWRWGGLLGISDWQTVERVVFGRELGDEEELCPTCCAPLSYDYHDGVIRCCETCRLYWMHDEYEHGLAGNPMGDVS